MLGRHAVDGVGVGGKNADIVDLLESGSLGTCSMFLLKRNK